MIQSGLSIKLYADIDQYIKALRIKKPVRVN